MSDFDALLAEYTEKGNAKVHGVICKCVDKYGILPFKVNTCNTNPDLSQAMKSTARSPATPRSHQRPNPSAQTRF
jgi:hypothetical protein